MGREEMEWLNFISGGSLGEDPQTPAPRSVKDMEFRSTSARTCLLQSYLAHYLNYSRCVLKLPLFVTNLNHTLFLTV